jgi:hypothetical protein
LTDYLIFSLKFLFTYFLTRPKKNLISSLFKPNQMNRSKDIFNLIIIACLLLFGLTLSSCATQGYGCKGNQSWGKMVNRINAKY